jgi:hypothetical protein
MKGIILTNNEIFEIYLTDLKYDESEISKGFASQNKQQEQINHAIFSFSSHQLAVATRQRCC